MEKYPSPAYLLGSMVEDDVPQELALKIANGYAEARTSLDDDQTQRWLMAMLPNLGPVGSRPSTAMSVLTQPSTHLEDHYNSLAASVGWEEA